MVLTVLQRFCFLCFYKLEVLDGLCVWIEVSEKILFSCLHFERISDFLFSRVFCDV